MLKMFRRMNLHLWLLFLAGSVFVLIQVGMELTIPDYMEEITVLVKTPGSSIADIGRNGLKMLLCAAISVGGAVAGSFFSVRLASLFSRQLRKDIYDRVETYTMEELDAFSKASLITRSTNDVTQVQNFMSRCLQQVVRAPIMIVLAIVKLSGKYWQWSLMTALAVGVMICVLLFLIRYTHPKMRRRQALTDDLSRLLRENMTGIRVIRAYNAQEYQQQRFDRANETLTSSERSAQHGMSMMRAMVKFMNNMLMVGIYCVGAILIASAAKEEQLSIFSAMVVYTSYAAILLQAFMELNMVFNVYPRAAVSAARINEVLEKEPSVKDGSKTQGDPEKKGTLEFNHVSFRYPGTKKDVLHDVSFTAHPGETVAIIGATGAGKSTIANLIPRLYETTQGDILIDGVSIRAYTQKTLHNMIGYAAQSATLFTGTVRSNVEYGESVYAKKGEEAVWEALAIAQAREFVDQMDGGLDASISRGGTNVSGGQKQRLSIARIVHRKPSFYVFDDTFSALDYRTDKALRAALKEKTAGITTILIAQRIGTIRDADRILVLDEGTIVGEGTHEELLKSCNLYREIASTQLSEEELASA